MTRALSKQVFEFFMGLGLLAALTSCGVKMAPRSDRLDPGPLNRYTEKAATEKDEDEKKADKSP